MRGFACLAFIAFAGCDACGHVAEPTPGPASSPPPLPIALPVMPAPTRITPALLAKRPHDPGAFTQGLVFANGVFLEGTGQFGESSLRRVDPATGKILKLVKLPDRIFGEGIARSKGELFEITWQDHVCYVYDEQTFEKKREVSYEGEGWGLTTDPSGLLVMSDGTPVIRFRDPATFKEVRNITVKDGAKALTELNELEWIHGEIFANIWQTNLIARIDPTSGRVTGYLDMSGLPEPSHADDPDAVLNGIAFDEGTNRLFVTGKRWRFMYEIATP